MANILIVDDKAYIRNRIKELLEEHRINIYEATSSRQLFTILAQLNYDIDLIILEINLGNENGLDIISKLNIKGINIPVLILTTENRKKQFIKGIKAGVVDYMLKPFNDKVLVKRVLENIQEGKNKIAHRKFIIQGNKVSVSNVKELKNKEISPFKPEVIVNKQENNLSIIMITFFKKVEEFTVKLEREYKIVADIIYPKLKETLKDPEVLTKYGFQSFIAAFRSVDNKEEKVIEEKIRQLFEELKRRTEILKPYYLECTFVNYPNDGRNKEELILKARQETIEKINNFKRMEKRWI